MVMIAELTFSAATQAQPVSLNEDRQIVLAHKRHEIDFDHDDFEDPASFCCGSCLSCFLIIPFLFLLSSLLIGLLVYRKASRRRDPDAALWGLMGVLLNVLGLFIYLNARGGKD